MWGEGEGEGKRRRRRWGEGKRRGGHGDTCLKKNNKKKKKLLPSYKRSGQAVNGDLRTEDDVCVTRARN